MFKTIECKRCRLRALKESDLMTLAEYKSNPSVAIYQSWSSYSYDEAKLLYKKLMTTPFAKVGQWYQIALADRETDNLVGDFGIHFLDFQQVEVGFTVASEHQGRGYATESLLALLDYLFSQLKLHRIIAITDTRNIAANRLLETVGFRKEAHFHKNVFFKGEWSDEFLFAYLAEDWSKESRL